VTLLSGVHQSHTRRNVRANYIVWACERAQ